MDWREDRMEFGLRQASEQGFAAGRSREGKPMQSKQLRRLHALWRRWTGRLGLSTTADRQLRHYYVWLFTESECQETKALSEKQAGLVIQWLARLVRRAEVSQDHLAGTAGRRGYPEQPQVPPSDSAWRALWGCAAALGMSRLDLENFIRRRYAGVGLRDLAELRTMADLNRVLWGLKAMLRHRAKSGHTSNPVKRAA